jgi:transcription elongation factor GreA
MLSIVEKVLLYIDMRVPYRKPGIFSQIKNDPFLTEGKFDELKKDLERLKSTQPQAAADVSRLAELGDFSENAAYQFAKGRLRGINNAILRLEKQLQFATIIKLQEQKDTVQLGSTVTIQQGDTQKTYQILGSSETSPHQGVISHNSPLGAALMGHRVGEVVSIKVVGKEKEYRIVGIK